LATRSISSALRAVTAKAGSNARRAALESNAGRKSGQVCSGLPEVAVNSRDDES
jgi:hypothetical protein